MLDFKVLEKDFLENLDDLLKAVYKLGDEEFEDLWEYPDDYYNTENARGLIYYYNTEAFAKEYYNEIYDFLNLENMKIEKQLSLDELTSLTWIELIRELESFKEDYLEENNNEENT